MVIPNIELKETGEIIENVLKEFKEYRENELKNKTKLYRSKKSFFGKAR